MSIINDTVTAIGYLTILLIVIFSIIAAFTPRTNTLDYYRFDAKCEQRIELMNGEKYVTHYIPYMFGDGLIGIRLQASTKELFVKEMKVEEVCK